MGRPDDAGSGVEIVSDLPMFRVPFSGGTSVPEGSEASRVSRSCPASFCEENGTSRSVSRGVGCGVPCVPVYKTGHGHPGPRNVLSRRPFLSLHACGEHVLTGLDDEPCGLTARVDPYPLSALGEVAALRAGRHTYWLRHGCLERRDLWNIPGHPPAPDRLVLAEHRCGERPPDDWLAPPSPRPPRPAPQEF